MKQPVPPYLERNSFGIFEIRWTEQRRSMRKSTGTRDEADAQRKLGEFLIERLGANPATKEPMKVGEILDIYLAEHVDDGKVEDKDRQHDIANNLRPFFGGMYAKDVMPKDVKLYREKRADGTVGKRKAKSDGTHRRELNMLIAAINYASATRKKDLPTDHVPYIPLPEAPGSRDIWLTEQEEAQFLAAAEEENHDYPLMDRGYLFVHIALGTAARRKSIEKLTWPQVDFEARRIRFNPPGRAQTAKRRVPVAISDRLLPVLQRAYELRTGPHVLHKPSAITKRFDAICQRAYKATGNPKFLKVTPHVLRHTWATLAARSGKVDIYEIAGVLGDTIQTVMKNYLHHCPEHLRNAVNFRSGSEMPTVPTPPVTDTKTDARKSPPSGGEAIEPAEELRAQLRAKPQLRVIDGGR